MNTKDLKRLARLAAERDVLTAMEKGLGGMGLGLRDPEERKMVLPEGKAKAVLKYAIELYTEELKQAGIEVDK